MSCMELNKTHYQFVANQLNKILITYDKRIEFYQTKRHFDSFDCKEREQKVLWFITMLQAWNQRAYLGRYPELTRDDRSPQYITSIEYFGQADHYQLLKALECIDYQCVDALDYESSEDCKTLRLIISELKNKLVTEQDQYKLAQWAIA